MSSKDQLIEFLKEQVKVENKIVDALNKSLPEIENPTVKGVFERNITGFG